MPRWLRIVLYAVIPILLINVIVAILGGPFYRSSYIIHGFGLLAAVIALLWRDMSDRAAIRRSRNGGLPPAPGADVTSRTFNP